MNSHLPVGRLADRLETLSRERAWLAIVVATAAITVADKYIPGVGFGLWISALIGTVISAINGTGLTLATGHMGDHVNS